MRSSVWGRHAAAAIVAAAQLAWAETAPTQAQTDEAARLFTHLAGSWSGAGTVRLMGGGAERLRCRAAYSPSDSAHLGLALRCASDSFKMDVRSEITRDGNHLAGSWQETTFGVGGTLAGTIRGDRIDAVVNGPGTSGRLTMSVRGNAQSVTLSSQSQLLSGTAVVVMRHE